MEIVIPNLAALPQAVQDFLEAIGTARKVAFYGEIGAGKTTFIKELCAHFGVRETVASPTFSIVNEYSFLDKSTSSEQLIYHLDLYRLKQIEEAYDIGIEDYLYDKHYCFIEWPDLIEPILPEDCIKIKLLHEDSLRKIVFLD